MIEGRNQEMIERMLEELSEATLVSLDKAYRKGIDDVTA
jgi:hypothetical protein